MSKFKYNSEKLDSCLNTFRETFSKPKIDNFKGSVILPLDFSLEMDGIAGLIPHSAFEIPTNSLPSNYLTKKGESKIAFILHTIDHNFNNNKWTTKITGQTLNIRFDELTETQKAALETQITSSTGGRATGGGSAVSSARTLSIPVVKYLIEQKQQNGKLNNAYLRNLNIPDDPTSNRIHKLFPTAASQWEKLIIEARKAGFKVNETNISYVNGAAYRGPTSNNSVHGWGCAVDIQSLVTAQGGQNSFNNTAAAKKVRDTNRFYIWLNNNAKNFGWVNPLYMRDGVGIEEAWHWEYHGPVNI
jgi:hypothetical protein